MKEALKQKGGQEIQRVMQGMQKKGINDDAQAFFAKITTADQGMTFDLEGNLLIYKRPNVKNIEENMGYSVK